MIALNCLAASLLMATAVGGSLGIPMPYESVSPVISHFTFIDSLTAGSEEHYAFVRDVPRGDEFYYIVDSSIDGFNVHFAGLTDFDGTGSTVYTVLFDGDLDLMGVDQSLVSETLLGDYPLMVLLINSDVKDSFEEIRLDLYLPDLSYWYADADDQYYLNIAVGVTEGDSVAYLGDCFEYLSANSQVGLVAIDPAELGADVNPVTAITDGLTAIVPLGGALTDGFDAVFMDDGALTAVGMFAFILMGVGISVGITKKCFNWVTGRHGM